MCRRSQFSLSRSSAFRSRIITSLLCVQSQHGKDNEVSWISPTSSSWNPNARRPRASWDWLNRLRGRAANSRTCCRNCSQLDQLTMLGHWHTWSPMTGLLPSGRRLIEDVPLLIDRGLHFVSFTFLDHYMPQCLRNVHHIRSPIWLLVIHSYFFNKWPLTSSLKPPVALALAIAPAQYPATLPAIAP